jgi:hypothetical protein
MSGLHLWNRPGLAPLREERGQAIFMLLMVAVSMLFFLSLMFHSGTIILLKMRLQNTADAAAMAGATMQARGMSQIARLNREIVRTVDDANDEVFGDLDPFPSDADAYYYIRDHYLVKIEQYVDQINQIRLVGTDQARTAAINVAKRNISVADVVWHTPTLRDPHWGNRSVMVTLDRREDAEFHFVRRLPGGSAQHRYFRLPAYFGGKRRQDVVYSAVEVALNNLRLTDSLFTSNIDRMVAYAAAKPWGGDIGGSSAWPWAEYVTIRWKTDVFPDNVATQGMRSWHRSIPVYLLWDPLDYDIWLVSIGHKDLKPRPMTIPSYNRFVH